MTLQHGADLFEIDRAGVGRKFQTPSIYEDLTVFENLEVSFPRGRSVFGALGFRRDAEVRDRVEEIANMVVYVASKEASATNGAALRAEGGIVQTIA